MKKQIALVATATIDFIYYSLTTLVSGYEKGEFDSYHIFVLDGHEDIADEVKETVHSKYSWINLIFPEDLANRSQESYLEVFNYYSKGEVANLSKYYALKHILENQAIDLCVFVDSDMLIYEGIREEILKIEDSAVYLTPHMLEPTTSENDHEVMVHGWINAGFMVYNGHNKQSFVILDWLISRISERGYLAPQYSLSCDQTWVSALPVMFFNDIKMSCNEGINVAYWNLFNSRRLIKFNSKVHVNESPLLLFHFSGYDFENKQKLSKHASYMVEKGTVLSDICEEYERRVAAEKKIHQRLMKFDGLKCSSARLLTRIKIGQRYNAGVDIYKTTLRPGIFSRFGGLADAVIKKIWGRIYN